MSWSVYLNGTPAEVIAGLDRQLNGMSGLSKTEYETSLPALKTLVGMNLDSPGDTLKRFVFLEASGSANGNAEGGIQSQHCSVKLDVKYLEI